MKTELTEAADFFSRLYNGAHHIPRSGLKPFGEGWSVNHYGDLSTYDFNTLTTLVFLAHDMCMRATVMQSGPNMVKICVWKRERGVRGKMSMTRRHPTLDEAVALWKERH